VAVVVHPLRLVPVVAQVAVEAAATASKICNCNNKIQFFFLKFRRRFNTEQFRFVFHFVPMDFQIDLFVIKGEGDEWANKRRHSKHETSKLISQNETSKLPIFIFFRVDCFDK
jgi:hypothetical protein